MRPRTDPPYESPYKLPVIEPIEVAAFILIFLVNLGLWAPYLFFLFYSMEPGILQLW